MADRPRTPITPKRESDSYVSDSGVVYRPGKLRHIRSLRDIEPRVPGVRKQIISSNKKTKRADGVKWPELIANTGASKVSYALRVLANSAQKPREILDVMRLSLKGRFAAKPLARLMSKMAIMFPPPRRKKRNSRKGRVIPFRYDLLGGDPAAREAALNEAKSKACQLHNSTDVFADEPKKKTKDTQMCVYKYESKGGNVVTRVIREADNTNSWIPPAIVERRSDKLFARIHDRDPQAYYPLKSKFDKAQKLFRNLVGRQIKGFVKRFNEKRAFLFEDRLVGKVVSRSCGPGASIIGLGGMTQSQEDEILNAELCDLDDLMEKNLVQYWPNKNLKLTKLHYAHRNDKIIHIPGGAAHDTMLTDRGAVINASFQLAVRGIDARRHPWTLIKHTDKDGRIDYHLLVGRAGSDGIYGMDTSFDGCLGAMAQNFLTASSGLDEAHQVEMPWNFTGRSYNVTRNFLNGKDRKGKPLAAKLYDPVTEEYKLVPLLGEKAVRRWVAAMSGNWLTPVDAMLIFKVASARSQENIVINGLVKYCVRAA